MKEAIIYEKKIFKNLLISILCFITLFVAIDNAYVSYCPPHKYSSLRVTNWGVYDLLIGYMYVKVSGKYLNGPDYSATYNIKLEKP